MEDYIPSFDRVKDKKLRFYQLAAWGLFKEGVWAAPLATFILMLILTIIFARFVPPTLYNWLFYLVPSAGSAWLVSRINTQHRSFIEHVVSKTRYHLRPKVTKAGKVTRFTSPLVHTTLTYTPNLTGGEGMNEDH